MATVRPLHEAIASHPYITLALIICTCYAFSCAHGLCKNIQYARSTGLNYIVSPLHQANPLQIMLTQWRPLQCLFGLAPEPLKWYLFELSYAQRNQSKHHVADRLGRVYLIVSPGGVVMHCEDADAVVEITSQRNQFPKPVSSYKTLSIYGPNLVASDGAEWLHHRKYAAPTFNERNNRLVFHESVRQTLGMIQHWFSGASSPSASSVVVETFGLDTMRLALHVLSAGGFGVPLSFLPDLSSDSSPSYPFTDTGKAPEGFSLPWREVIQYVSYHIVRHTMVRRMVPCWIPSFLLPSVVVSHQRAHDDFENYMKAMIARARSATASGAVSERENVLTMMVTNKDKGSGLTEGEIRGNTFILTIAGHETTAHSLHHALLLLSIYKDVQRWVTEGVDAALESEPENPLDWSYERVYPKLREPLYLMLEVLRLYPMVPTFPKYITPGAPITYGGTTYNIRPMNININAASLHTNPFYWGPTAHDFDPTRWDSRNPDSYLRRYSDDKVSRIVAGLEYGDDVLHKPKRGSYVPFSDGVRACLGKKFAQIEFCIAIAVLLRRYRLELVDMTEEQVKRKLDTTSAILTPTIVRDVKVRVVRREGR